MRSKNAKALTTADKERFANMKDLGCIACILDGFIEPFETYPSCDVEIHHFLVGNKRMGHQYTAPLCRWSHQGVGDKTRWTEKGVVEKGPSWHKHRRAFRERYGSDAELIETVNKYLEPSCQP